MLYNEPKLLKSSETVKRYIEAQSFSALQRAEIAEMHVDLLAAESPRTSFSALQRAEIAEIKPVVKRHLARDPVFQCSSTSRNC